MKRGWSLASRLTRLFALTTSVLVVGMFAISAWFLYRSTDEELTKLMGEELDEFVSSLEQVELSADAVKAIAVDLQRRHPTASMAWRLWEPDAKTLWGEFGRVDHLTATAPNLKPLLKNQKLGNGARWRTEHAENGMYVGILVDGSKQFAMLWRYQAYGGALVLISVVAIFGLGRVFMGRATKMLRQVAESARAVRRPDARMDVDVAGAPDEIRDVVDALQQLLENIRTENEKNRVFTASLAHELRSPIQNLMGETEVALITQRDAPAYRRVLQSHLEELRELADAVDNLVTICSARPTKVDGQHESRESFDLADESRMRLARERGYAASRGVNVEISSSGDTRLYGDREGLLRALRNLTANAIEWSAEGSSVTVHLEGENGDLVITVDDAGPGVPEELREKIFDPFFRGPAAHGRRVGYGLGLAIVRSAVTDHGGQIEIGTSPLGGARFRMILPRGVGTSPGSESEAEARDAAGLVAEAVRARASGPA